MTSRGSLRQEIRGCTESLHLRDYVQEDRWKINVCTKTLGKTNMDIKTKTKLTILKKGERLKFLATKLVKNQVFWGVTSRLWMSSSRRFGGSLFLSSRINQKLASGTPATTRINTQRHILEDLNSN